MFWNFSPVQFISCLIINLEFFFSCCWQGYFIKKRTQNLAYFHTRKVYYKPKLPLNIFYHKMICLHTGWNKKTYGWTFKQEKLFSAFIKLKIFFHLFELLWKHLNKNFFKTLPRVAKCIIYYSNQSTGHIHIHIHSLNLYHLNK